MRKKSFALLTVLAIAAALAGCSGKKQDAGGTQAQGAEEKGETGKDAAEQEAAGNEAIS